VTLSFLFTTPDVLAPTNPFGGFLMKDIMLLGQRSTRRRKLSRQPSQHQTAAQLHLRKEIPWTP